MKKSTKSIIKEFSIHLIIITTSLGLVFLFFSLNLESDSEFNPPKRFFINQVLELSSIGYQEYPIEDNSKGKSSSSVFKEHKITNGRLIQVKQSENQVIFYSGMDSSSVESTNLEIPNLEQYQGDWSKLRLACDGGFFEYMETITYSCYHLPLVYLFNSVGKPLGYISTIDNVDYPKFRIHSGRTTLEHGLAHNSNRASFVLDGLVYILSYQTSPQDHFITLDCYKLKDKRYAYSIRAEGDISINNHQVYGIGVLDNMLVVFTEKGVYSLFN